MSRRLLLLFLILQSAAHAAVLPGIDVLLSDSKNAGLISGKRIGLITNRTGVSSTGRSTIDLLAQHPQAELVALFSPEHGIRGEEEAGRAVDDATDATTGLPVYSLYGKTQKPTEAMLKGLDLLVYDIQDIGVRSYTYISTMGYAMEAAEKAGIDFMVLDRPDPMGGNVVDGPVLDKSLTSFIGLYELPWVYGMTPGEVARWIKREKTPRLNLSVVPVGGWRRGMIYEETGLRWVPPSPNVPKPQTPFFYAITGAIGELGTMSEGVGTDWPFELLGAPWMDGEAVAARLNETNLPGVRFEALTFTPTKYGFKDKTCRGVRIVVSDRARARPSAIMLAMAHVIQQLHADRNPFPAPGEKAGLFDKALGYPVFRQMIRDDNGYYKMHEHWQQQVESFLPSRESVLIYR